MENELIIKPENLVTIIENRGISDVIKPLVREIHLFDSFVAGTTHLNDKSILESLKEGDVLLLQREDNKFDSNAIIVFTEDKKKVGYIPEKDNVIFARLMDAGKLLQARISQIQGRTGYTQISIGIYLIDF